MVLMTGWRGWGIMGRYHGECTKYVTDFKLYKNKLEIVNAAISPRLHRRLLNTD